MPITEFLEKNSRLYPNEKAIVEITPQNQPERNITWREFNLIETAVVKISLAMLLTVISVTTTNITILGTGFTLMALGGIWMLLLILFKLKIKAV